MINNVLIKLHRWAGFPLGVLFIVTLVSGIVTGIDDFLDMQKSLDYEAASLSNSEVANAVAKLNQTHPSNRQILLPTVSVPAFVVSLRGEKFYYAPDSLKLLEHEVSQRDGFFSFMLRLHRNYLLGRTGAGGLSGAEIVAWVGLLSMLISLLGIYLWWPHRRTFKVRRLVPTNNKISSYYFSHLSAGVVTVAVVILFALTGAGITYRTIAQSLLLPDQTESHTETRIYHAAGWLGAVNTAKSVFPNGDLISVSFGGGRRTPAQYADAAQFRFHTEGDWLGMAGSIVYIDASSGAYLGRQAFADYSAGRQLYELMLPLHTGRGITSVYLLSMLVMMSLCLVMVIAGVTSFVMKKSKLEKKLKQVSIKLTEQAKMKFVSNKETS